VAAGASTVATPEALKTESQSAAPTTAEAATPAAETIVFQMAAATTEELALPDADPSASVGGVVSALNVTVSARLKKLSPVPPSAALSCRSQEKPPPIVPTFVM
jgi:hypothetical protein